jgi:hypothetical protein
MARQIHRATSRWIMFSLLFSGMALSFGLLYWRARGGGIHEDSVAIARTLLLELYFPLLGIIAGFYFSQESISEVDDRVSLEAFTFITLLVGLWVIAPIAMLIFFHIEDTIANIEAYRVHWQTLAAAAIAFLFAKRNR